jgi:hypothetical protein
VLLGYFRISSRHAVTNARAFATELSSAYEALSAYAASTWASVLVLLRVLIR